MKSNRKFPRIPVAFEIHCQGGKKPLTLVSKDLSQGGIFLETPQVFPLGAQVDLEFKLPYAYGEIRSRGKVIRHQQEEGQGMVCGMAIEFLDLPEPAKKMISEYIQNTQEPANAG